MGKNKNPKQAENVKTTAAEQNGVVETAPIGMKKIKVKQVFRDKFDNTIRYKVGQILDIDEERAADLVKRNLAEFVVPTPTE